jgi:hypothetical protein
MDCRVKPGNDEEAAFNLFRTCLSLTPCDQELVARVFVGWDGSPGWPGAQSRKNFDMHNSKRLLLGLGAATLIMESVGAADRRDEKVTLAD